MLGGASGTPCNSGASRDQARLAAVDLLTVFVALVAVQSGVGAFGRLAPVDCLDLVPADPCRPQMFMALLVEGDAGAEGYPARR
jgi:hypothetical protein